MTIHSEKYAVKNEALDVLNGFIWHDSVLQSVRLIRTHSLDQVILRVDLLIDCDSQVSELTELVFHNCIKVTADMSWGIVCMSEGEMIYLAEATKNDEEIANYLSPWNREALDEYGAFKLDLASTGSTLYLVFQEVEVRRPKGPEKHNAPEPLGIPSA